MFSTERLPDGRIRRPRSVTVHGLIGDAEEILAPGDPGYSEAAADLAARKVGVVHPDVTLPPLDPSEPPLY